MTPEQIEQALTQGGWRLEGGFFSEYFIVGPDDGHTSIIAQSWVWEKETHVFELSDQRTERVYWVHAIPTPWQAKLLLEEHGSPQGRRRKKRRSWAPHTTSCEATVTLLPRVRSGRPSLACANLPVLKSGLPL